MGSLFKSKSEAVIDPGAQEAWNIAKPYQQEALAGISGIADQPLVYSGQRVADLNPYQTGSATALGGFGSSTSPYAYGMTGIGAGNLATTGNVGSNYQDIYGRASMDPTQMILSQAGQYANNPYTEGMIDAANRDTVRGLTEQQLPSLMRGMVGTGNTNATAGMKEGQILTRGAQDRMADVASQIRSQFFGTGLNMAQNQFNQNLQNMMQSNQGLMGAGQYGAGLMGAGQDYATNNFMQGQQAGGVYQNQNQNLLNADMAAFNESWQNPLSVYQALNGAAANTQAKTAAGVSTSPSIASQLGSLALGGVGAYNSMFPKTTG